jgi:hypothetical protein
MHCIISHEAFVVYKPFSFDLDETWRGYDAFRVC